MSEELAEKAAQLVREVVAEAEKRAEQIVREAEADATRIRERAEAEAAEVKERAEAEVRDRIERAKQALAGVESHAPAEPPRAPEMASAPKTERAGPPEPEPLRAEPEVPTSSPAEPRTSGGGNGDDAAARLVAMKLAVDGKGREEIEAELTQRFGAGDRSALLDDVLARAGR